MRDEKYPRWIDEFTKAFHNGFVNMVPCSWGPIDGYAILGLLNGSFLSKLHDAISRIKKKNVPLEEVAKCFPSPSGFRIAVYWAIVEYQLSSPKNKNQFREIIEFLIDILNSLLKKDVFAYESNITHLPEEVDKLLKTVPWGKGDSTVARELGKLYNSLAALVFALYKDFFPQDSHEIYGPYDASKKFGPQTTFVIKHFPKIRAVELWPEMGKLKYSEIKMFQVYKEVKFRCELVGMHSIYDGDLINNLIAYAVTIDGAFTTDIQRIKDMSNYFAEIATEQSLVYEGLPKAELKKKFLDWLCYQFIYFFKLVSVDWRPTREMLDAVKDKEIADRFELEKAPTYEEYATSPDFEVYWLKELYKI